MKLVAFAVTAALAAGACVHSPTSAVTGVTPSTRGAPREVTVHAVCDLPRQPATQELSGTAFDPATRTLFALQDVRPNVIPLVASDDFKSFTVGAPIALTGRPEGPWDGEALVRTSKGFIVVTNESTPAIERFDRNGVRTGAEPVPRRFTERTTTNKGFESLAIDPDERILFMANESALKGDGGPATKDRGTTVRILARELASGADIELAYRTEPLGPGASGDMGVSDIAAVDGHVLLVLERGFQADHGNTVRIFRVDLATGTRVDGLDALTDATPVLTKTLLVDLGALPPGAVTHPSLQPNPILDNYEGLALGPVLPDGRRLLFVTSDDNGSMTQVPRVLVLAVRGL
jgi:hypothetical protein